MRYLRSVPAMRPPGSPRCGVPGRLEYIRAAGERPPRARPQRRGSPGPIPNPAVKPAFAESTAAPGCGRAGRRARGGRFSHAPKKARRGRFPCGPSRVWGMSRGRGVFRAACAEHRRPVGLLCGPFRVFGASSLSGAGLAGRAGRARLRDAGALPTARLRALRGVGCARRDPRGRPTDRPRWRSAARRAARVSSPRASRGDIPSWVLSAFWVPED